MIFGSIDLAKRIESAQAQNQADYAKVHQDLNPGSLYAALRLGSGAALFAGTDSPITQAFGLGLDGEVSENTITMLEEFFFSRGSAVKIGRAHV